MIKQKGWSGSIELGQPFTAYCHVRAYIDGYRDDFKE